MTQHLYEDIFDARQGTTLFVDSFSLGAWIAGMEFFNSVRWSAEHGTHITVVTPGIDKVEAINQIKKLAPLFSRVVLAGYPPFVKDILDHGIMNGVDWKSIDLRLLFAGEAVSEVWTGKVLNLIGRDNSELDRAINIYGMAESGVVAHTTPVSTLLRRNLGELAKTISGLPDAGQVMGMYQYYPLARYFEVAGDDAIVLTANAGLPLIRCGTRDNGGILWQEILAHDSVKELADARDVDLTQWQLPFVYLSGRKDLSISLYALNVYIENIKYALETSGYAPQLSGFFTMGVTQTDNLDQRFEIAIELAKGGIPSTALAEALAQEVIAKVSLVNSEYAKLYSTIGDRAKPHITLVPYGDIQTTPGKKHKWIKRT
jgi:phenylacetate-CoA ligase